MQNVTEIVKGIHAGTIDPIEGVEQALTPSVHIKDVPINDLKVDVLDCGFPSLNDAMVFKRNRGELIIFGARPSMGKSAFLFQVAAHVAKTDNVLIYSLEMDKESIKARMLAAESGQSLQRILKGSANGKAIKEANERLGQLKYHIDDRSGLDVKSLQSSALDFHRKHPLSLVVVDYLQLVKGGSRASRAEEVGDVSAELKNLAKMLKCPVLAACQLNRNCVNRGNEMKSRGKEPDYRPEMGDLRESGNIEQDADGILFLSRHEVHNPGYRLNEADISVAKQRNGPTGHFVFKWLGSATKFKDEYVIGEGDI